jgi:hypothetical protein
VQNKLILVAASFPVMTVTSAASLPTQVALDGQTLAAARITSVDLMARRRLKDDMPGIMLRAAIRSTASAVLQYQAQRAGDKDHAAGMALAAAAVMAGSSVLDSADDRTWRALPSEISVARGRVRQGVHTVTLDTPEGPRSARVRLSGRHAVIDLRLLRHQLFVNAPREAR